jgi:hypothetical protein
MPIDDDELNDDRERDKVDKKLLGRLEGLLPDLVKRTFYAGLGAVFTTEEGIRKIANEFSLPKDVASYLINSAQTTKDELFRIVAKEMRDFLENLNIGNEVAKLLTTLSFEIKTEIRFIPNSECYTGVDPDVKAQVRLKRSDRNEKSDKPDRVDKSDRPDKPDRPDRPVGDADLGDPESTRDDTGRLRRLWRRATGNGTGTDERDEDDDGGADENE